MTHYPDNDTSELDKPYLVQYAPDAPPVHTRADHGTTHADGKTILMRGNVHVYRGTSGKDPGGEAVSQEMLVILE